MTDDRVPAALAWATALSSREPYSAPARMFGDFTVRVAMGDPQAPFEKVLTVLEHNGLLSPQGMIASHVQLVVMGDYFDFGAVDQHARAAADGLRLLAWLAAHPADQVILLAGNHDIARISELAALSDEDFALAREEAVAAYTHKRPRRPEAAFREAYNVPCWEILARDFSAFREVQRRWVEALLRAGRLRIAYADARSSLLMTHAGVSTRELDVLSLEGAERSDSRAIASALERRFERAVRAWRAPEAFAIEGLHRPGDAEREGEGIFFHRFAVDVERAGAKTGTRRRAHVSEVPLGIVQAIGHIRDKKSRALLALDAGAARDGLLRRLTVRRDGAFTYETDLAEAPLAEETGCMLMLDGGMSHVNASDYTLLDLDTLVAHAPPKE